MSPRAMDLMKVLVFPPHGSLDHGVQLFEGGIGGRLDPTPDWRLGVGKNDFRQVRVFSSRAKVPRSARSPGRQRCILPCSKRPR
jgi:hypothetical protein